MINDPTYNAEISAGSLMLKESRIIAGLLLDGADENAWYQAIIVKNVLQKNTPATAKRQTALMRKRLELMTPDLWKLVTKGQSDVALQSLLACAIKHSRLLGDFMLKVLRRHYKEFNKQVLPREWDAFLVECEHIDPTVKSWSENTRNKLGQVVYRILAEARYLENTRSLKIQPVSVIPEVRRYLLDYNEDYVLKSMEVAHE